MTHLRKSRRESVPANHLQGARDDFAPVTVDSIRSEALFFQLALTDEQCAKILVYLKLLKKWNRKVNLTGIRSDKDALRLHFMESLYAARHLPAGKLRVVDLGSGAGFPGLAMKITRPDLRMVLLDSRKKKTLFQREVIQQLALSHVVAYPLRLQEGPSFLQQADVVCWRGLKLEGKDFDFLWSNTPAHCLYLCFQGAGESTEKRLLGCAVDKIPIPQSESRTLLLARKKPSL